MRKTIFRLCYEENLKRVIYLREVLAKHDAEVRAGNQNAFPWNTPDLRRELASTEEVITRQRRALRPHRQTRDWSRLTYAQENYLLEASLETARGL